LSCPPSVDLTPLLRRRRRLHRPLLHLRHAAWRHGLCPAHLSCPSCRFVHTSTLADLSSSSPTGTPSPTSATVVSAHATRSDQPMCVIHPAPVTSVLIERALSPSMEGCRCVASSCSSGIILWSSLPLLPHHRPPRPWPHRQLVAARFTHGLHQAVQVLSRLFRALQPRHPDHFAVCWKVWFPFSLRLAQPRRQHRHLVPDYFIYSSNSRRWHLLLRLLLHLRPPWRPSLLVPQTTSSGCASSLARPVLAIPLRAHCPRRIPGLGKLGHASPDDLTASASASTPSTIASTRCHLCLRRLLHHATIMAPPRAPTASCAASSSSATSTAMYDDHSYPTHDILDHGYWPSSLATSTSAQRSTFCLSNLVGFHSSHSVCDTLTVVTAGDVSSPTSL